VLGSRLFGSNLFPLFPMGSQRSGHYFIPSFSVHGLKSSLHKGALHLFFYMGIPPRAILLVICAPVEVPPLSQDIFPTTDFILLMKFSPFWSPADVFTHHTPHRNLSRDECRPALFSDCIPLASLILTVSPVLHGPRCYLKKAPTTSFVTNPPSGQRTRPAVSFL